MEPSPKEGDASVTLLKGVYFIVLCHLNYISAGAVLWHADMSGKCYEIWRAEGVWTCGGCCAAYYLITIASLSLGTGVYFIVVGLKMRSRRKSKQSNQCFNIPQAESTENTELANSSIEITIFPVKIISFERFRFTQFIQGGL